MHCLLPIVSSSINTSKMLANQLVGREITGAGKRYYSFQIRQTTSRITNNTLTSSPRGGGKESRGKDVSVVRD